MLLCVGLLLFSEAQSQDKKNDRENQEPYFFEIVAKKEKELNERIKKNNGSTKGVGYKSFNRWKAFWEPRVGTYGKFSEITGNIQEATSKSNFNCSSDASWTSIGPSSFPAGTSLQRGLGRLDFVKLHPDYNGTSNQTVFAGGRPGLWRSTNNGNNWTQIGSDKFEVSACSDVAVMENSSGTEILLAATGTKKSHFSPTLHSIGLKRSVNGGSTWTTVHLEATPWEIGDEERITEIAVDPNANNRVYVTVIKFSWAATSDYFGTTTKKDNYKGKVFVSENYGLTWAKIYEGFAVEDFEFKTDNSNTFYFSGHKLVQGRRLGTNNYVFTDLTPQLAGFSFNSLSWDNGHAQRMEVEVSAANPNVIYTFAQYFDPTQSTTNQRKLWKSIDAGLTFSLENNANFPTGIGWIRGSLEVSQQNENLVYITDVLSGRSTDGGVTFSTMSGFHVDTNDVEVSNTNHVFLANDAGVYRSVDNGLTWQIASEGLAVSEIYDIGMSLRTNSSVPDIIEGGFQDTNCMVRQNNGNWAHSTGTGGDGMVCIVDPVDPNIVYSEAQNGITRRSTNGGLSFSNYSVGGSNGLWVTPMVLDPNNHNRLLVGKRHLQVRVAGSSATQITIPFSVANSQSISAIKVAPSNSNIIYIAYQEGIADFDAGAYSNWWQDPNRKMRQQFLKTTDGGVTWTDVSPADLNKGSHGYISSIEVHSSDPNKVWVGYGAYNIKNRVVKSDDGGATWEGYAQGLEAVPVNDIVITPTHNNGIKRCDFLYLATDFGVYYRSSNMSEWECYTEGIPNVPVMDLEIDEYQNIIRCATFGRGVWEAGLHPDDSAYNNSLFTFTTTCASDGTTSVTVTPNAPADNHHWSLYETSAANQTGGNFTVQQVGSSQCCSGGSKTFTGLDPNKFYYIKHGVWDACHRWQETRKYIPSINESAQPVFHFENAVGQSKTTFCYNEDVYMNGIATEGETRYFFDAWRRPAGSTGAFSHYANYGWTTNQQVGIVNLSYEFLNNGDNPGEQFVAGYEYQIKLAIGNPPCFGWKSTTRNFTVVSCFINDPIKPTKGFLQKDINEDAFVYSVTPNPSKDIFTVKLNQELEGSIQIVDQKGVVILNRALKKGNTFQIDLSSYAVGMYYLKITSASHTKTLKLLKQ